MSAAGDASTALILRRKYNATGCLHCRQQGHTHLNCPKRPCYLCKKSGHLVHDCPFRHHPGAHAATLKNLMQARASRSTLHGFLSSRELHASLKPVHSSDLHIRSRQFDAQVVNYHARQHEKRITALEWSPDGRFLLSGDKSGHVALFNASPWAFGDDFIPHRAHPTSVEFHRCNVTAFQFHPFDSSLVYTASADGTVRTIQMDRMESDFSEGSLKLDLNPDGWQSRSKFKMAYGLALDPSRKCLYVGASDGCLSRLDVREGKENLCEKFHKDKIATVHPNPNKTDLIVTASNDRNICLWDARMLKVDNALSSYQHGRAVSSAYFSPNTGAKLLTTSLDNKIRVWKDVHAFGGQVGKDGDTEPMEIIHSHNFNRYLNAFRACWDPKDWRDDLFVCGRYMGDSYRFEDRECILHPVDMFSAGTGALVHSLIDEKASLICTTNRFNPMVDMIATAASRDVILWGSRGGTKRELDGDASTDEEIGGVQKKVKVVLKGVKKKQV